MGCVRMMVAKCARCMLLNVLLYPVLTSSHVRLDLQPYSAVSARPAATLHLRTHPIAGSARQGARVLAWQCVALRGGEQNLRAEKRGEEDSGDAAVMQSLGETVSLAEERQLAEIRERVVNRVALDDTDISYLAALRNDPSNVPAIKAHAAAILHSSSPSPTGSAQGCTADVSEQHDDGAYAGPSQLSRDAGEQDAGLFQPVVVGADGVRGEERDRMTRRAVAVELYRYALMLLPSDADCWLALANLHLAADTNRPHPEPVGAEAALFADGSMDQMMGVSPEDSVGIAQAMIDMALRLKPSHCSALLARGSMERDVQHDFAASRRTLLQALRALDAVPPANAEDCEEQQTKRSNVLTSLGLTADAAGNHAEAEARYRASIDLCKNADYDGVTATLLAVLLHSQGRLEEAVHVLRRASCLCATPHTSDVSLHYNLALLLLEQDSDANAEEAMEVLQRAARLHPEDLDVRTKLGWLLFATELDENLGAQLLRQVLAIEPAHPSALVCVSRVMQELGLDLEKELLPLILDAVKHDPLNPLVRREHARLHEMLHQWGGAEVEFRRALHLDPTDSLTRVDLARILTLSDAPSTSTINGHPVGDGGRGGERDEGENAEKQNTGEEEEQCESQQILEWVRSRPRPDAAASRFAALSPDDAPDDAPAHADMHAAKEEEEDLHAAREEEDAHTGTTNIVRRHALAHQEVVVEEEDVLAGTKNVESETSGTKKSGTSAFVKSEPVHTSGASFARLEEARALLQQALQQVPDFVEAHVGVGNLLGGVHCSLYEPTAAIAAYRCALELSPTHLEARTSLGEVLFHQGEAEEGLGHWERALEQQPDDADLRYNLGCLLAGAGDFAGAERQGEKEGGSETSEDWRTLAKREWARAVTLDPSHLQARYNLAMQHINENDDAAASAQLESVLAAHPAHAPSLYQLARMLERRGEIERAMSHYDTLVASHAEGAGFADAAARLASLLAQCGQVAEAESLFAHGLEALYELNDEELSNSQRAYGAHSLKLYSAFMHHVRADNHTAISALKSALALLPDPDIASELAYLQVRCSQPGSLVFQNGTELLQLILRHDSTHLPSLWRYAEALLREDCCEIARDYVARALAVDPTCAQALLLQAQLGVHADGYDPLSGVGQQVEKGCGLGVDQDDNDDMHWAAQQYALDQGGPDAAGRIQDGSESINLYRSGLTPQSRVGLTEADTATPEPQRDLKTTRSDKWIDLKKKTAQHFEKRGRRNLESESDSMEIEQDDSMGNEEYL